MSRKFDEYVQQLADGLTSEQYLRLLDIAYGPIPEEMLDMTDDELEIIAGSKAALAKVGKITNYTLVPAGLLQLVMNCMERDGEVKPVRKEIFEELQTKSIPFSEVSRYWTL